MKRTGDIARRLTVRLNWSGSAKQGADYTALPDRAVIPAGDREVRLVVKPKSVSRIAPTVEVTGVPLPSADYLMDGTEGTAGLSLIDGRAVRLEVSDIKASSAWKAPWGKMDLHEKQLQRLVDGSGLDRSVDPPVHDAKVETQWFAECVEAALAELVFDLGAACDLSDVIVWNANMTSRHGGGWGDGNTVRHWVRKLQILASEGAGGPWKDVTTVALCRPGGKPGEPGQRIPLGVCARYIRFRVADRTEMHCVGLSEVEFYGVKKP